jgi:hypothetical protein
MGGVQELAGRQSLSDARSEIGSAYVTRAYSVSHW